MMKKIAALVLAALAFAAPAAYAQAPAAAPVVDKKTETAVRDMLEAMNYRETMRQTMEQMSLRMPQMLAQGAQEALNSDQSLTDAQRKEAMAKIQAKMPELVAAVREVMEDPKLIDEISAQMPALYARYFTTQEIIALGRFYKTPLGAKTLKVLPPLMAESMEIGQAAVVPRTQALQERIMRAMQGAVKETK